MLTTPQLAGARLRNRIDIYRAELKALKALQLLQGIEIDVIHLECLLGEAEAKLEVLEMIDPKNN